MSISKIENQNKQSILQKEGTLFLSNTKNITSKVIKSFSGKPLEAILVFSYITTALGELFGRDYSWKWYGLLLLILIVFMVKGLVEPKTIFTEKKNNN